MRRGFKFVVLAAFLAVTLGFMAGQASALSFVGTRAGIFQNDFVDWSGFGPDFTTVTNGSTILTNSGLVTVLTGSNADMEIRSQGTGWSGNFANGDYLLWTNNNVGPLVLKFDTGMFAVGAQIQQDSFGSFVGVMEAYNGFGQLIGSYNLAGNSTSAGDNSAIFMGVMSDIPNILEVRYYMQGLQTDFAINQLALRDVCAQPVPVPAAVWLLGSGLVGLVGLRRKLHK